MDYQKIGGVYYVRMDCEDEIITELIGICRECNIRSATFSGIGGCQTAEIQTFIPEKGAFDTEIIEGMLELITISGNIIQDDSGEYYHHTHAMYSFKENGEHHVAAGHIKATKVLYTAEIELRPVAGGAIHRKFDPVTGTGFWDFQK